MNLYSRRSLLLAALPLALLLAWRPAAAATVPEGAASGFVQQLGDQAIGTLTKPELDKAAREAEFRRLLNDAFAIRGIGRFVLGRYWRGGSEEQHQRYLKAFENLIVATYAARFEQYNGQTFKVGGERADGDDGRIVESQIDAREGPPIKLQWRIRADEDGSLKIVDIMVEGVSMAITQRSEFAAVIQQQGGSLDGLIAELERKVEKLK